MTVLADCFYNIDEMYSYIEIYATKNNLQQTLRALPFAKEKHKGQMRKGKEDVPYIYHPLTVAYHALALGLNDDNMLAAALLHDVVEDCGVKAEALPVNEETKMAVRLLSKTDFYYSSREQGAMQYYEAIAENEIAIMIKILDRCNNVAGMAAAFSTEKMQSYIHDTRKWIWPLFDKARTRFPQYERQVFLLEYQIKSTMESINRLL